MSRTIEIGRAVLCSSITNTELWLTTLITISLIHGDINLLQTPRPQLLDLLSSESIWVERGPGMHLNLELTWQGEPLASELYQSLAEKTISAPVWAQLSLRAALVPTEESTARTVRIGIDHDRHSPAMDEANYHRLFSNVPAADVRPPRGFPRIALLATHCTMDILASRQRLEACAKRPRTSTRQNKPSKSLLASQLGSPASGSRKRRQVEVPEDSSPSWLAADIGHPTIDELSVQSNVLSPSSSFPFAHFDTLIDAALQISVCGNLKRPLNEVKLKANTFETCLSSIAPVIWRVGFSHALSQRASLSPTICRSLEQIARVQPKSMALKEKLETLISGQVQVSGLRSPSSINESDQNIAHDACYIEKWIWERMQKDLLSKSPPSLHSFIAREMPNSQGCEDMLADFEQAAHVLNPGPKTSSTWIAEDREIRKPVDEEWTQTDINESFCDNVRGLES